MIKTKMYDILKNTQPTVLIHTLQGRQIETVEC